MWGCELKWMFFCILSGKKIKKGKILNSGSNVAAFTLNFGWPLVLISEETWAAARLYKQVPIQASSLSQKNNPRKKRSLEESPPHLTASHKHTLPECAGVFGGSVEPSGPEIKEGFCVFKETNIPTLCWVTGCSGKGRHRPLSTLLPSWFHWLVILVDTVFKTSIYSSSRVQSENLLQITCEWNEWSRSLFVWFLY